MEGLADIVGGILQDEVVRGHISDVDLLMTQVLCGLNRNEVVLHTLRQLFPDQIAISEVSATAYPTDGKSRIQSRSRYLTIEGRSFGIWGELDIEQVLGNERLRFASKLKGKDLPEDTRVRVLKRRVKSEQDDFYLLCPDLVNLLQLEISKRSAMSQACHLSEKTPSALSVKPALRM